MQRFERYSGYKDSGVDWIGEIPAEWRSIRLSSLGNFSKGGGFSKSDLTEQGVSAVLYGDIYTRYEFFVNQAVRKISEKTSQNSVMIHQGDLLLTGSGETIEDIGKCVAYKGSEPAFAGGDVIIFKQKKQDSNYLSYLLNSHHIKEEKAKTAKGEIIVHTYGSKLKNIFIPLPPLPEQTAIANFLDEKTTKIDTAIAQKEQMISLLKERKQILIQNAVTKGIDPAAKMKDSGVDWIGEIPDRWEMRRVKNIFRLVVDPSEKNNDHELLSIYTNIGVKPRKELEERGNKASTTDGYLFVKKGDFIVNKLLAWMGAIGLSEYDGVTSPAYDILRPHKPISGMYYHYLFRTASCSSELKKHSRGIMEMRLRLYFDKFGVLLMPYPTATEQQEIVNFIETQSAKIDTSITLQQQQITKLKEYKSILIDHAVTGKIKVA